MQSLVRPNAQYMQTWSSIIRRIAFSIGLMMLFGLLLVVVVSGLQSDEGQLVFWSRRDGSYAVHVIDPHHLINFRLIEPPPYPVVDTPRFSRDGQRVAFETVDNARLRVFVKDIRQNILYTTDEGFEDRLPILSPDGRRVALWSAPYSAGTIARFQNWTLYIFEIASATSHQITTELAILPSDRPLWSPDGRRIAVRFWRAGVDEGAFIVDVESGNIQNVPGNVDPSSDLVWSPDGEQIAFRSARDLNPEVYILDVTNGTIRNLTQDEANDFQPTWSPNQQQIAFVSNRDGMGNIYLINVAGTDVTQLTETGGREPRWSLHGDQIAFLTQHGRDDILYLINTDGSGQRFITDLAEHDLFLGWYAIKKMTYQSVSTSNSAD